MGNAVSAIHQAAMEGNITKLRVAVQEQGQRINDSEPTRGWTALHITAVKGYDVMSRELLARGAEPNITDKEGRTPLHLAAGQGHLQVVQDLIRRRADASLADKEGKTALDMAAAAGYQRVVVLLREVTPLAAQPVSQQAAPPLGPYGYPAPIPAPGTPGAPPAAAPPPFWATAPRPPAGGGAPNGEVSVAAPSAPSAPAPDYQSYLTGGVTGLYPSPAYVAPQQPPGGAAWGQYIGGPAAAGGGGGGAYPAPYGDPGAGAHQQQPQPAYPPRSPVRQDQPWSTSPPPAAAQQQQQQQQQQPAYQGWGQQAPAGPPPAGMWPPPGPPQVPPAPAPERLQHMGRPMALSQVDEVDEDDGWGRPSGLSDWGLAGAGAGPGPGAGAGSPFASQPPGPPAPGPSAEEQAAAAEEARRRLEKVDLGKMARGFFGNILGNANKQRQQQQPPLEQPSLEQQRAQRGGSGAGAGSGLAGSSAASNSTDATGSVIISSATRHYTYEDLFNATQGFSESNKLGAGGYGPVYRGMLDGVPVAIKCLDTTEGAMQGEKEFLQEAQILGRLHHPHIVLLIGICPACCMLVYELLDHGNLEEHILGHKYGDLMWQDRVRVTAEVASALFFLHSAQPPIIHLDLKPANILMNRNLTSKIGDVGLSRLAPALAPGAPGGASTVLDTRLVGTPSFMDPEYLRTGRFGTKSDIFSLGVVMMQLLTGQDARSVIRAVEAALKKSQSDPASFSSIIDPRAGPWPLVEAAAFAHLAARCASLRRADRPDLRSEVLPGLLQLAERAKQYAADERAAAAAAGGGSGQGGGRALQRLRSVNSAGEPPSWFICPITQDVMSDPVFAADGFTYEREAIAGWIANHNTSPMTNLPLPTPGLTPNLTIRSAIREWLQRHPEYAQAAGLALA